MSIKQRVHRVEQKAGLCDQPTMFLIRTIYESRDGATDEDGPCLGAIMNGKTLLEAVSGENGETFEQLKNRVRNRCFELTGKHPQADIPQVVCRLT